MLSAGAFEEDNGEYVELDKKLKKRQVSGLFWLQLASQSMLETSEMIGRIISKVGGHLEGEEGRLKLNPP